MHHGGSRKKRWKWALPKARPQSPLIPGTVRPKAKPKTKPKTKEPCNRHHRKARANGGSDRESNISIVPIRAHHAFNALFGGSPTPDHVALTLEAVLRQINDVWLDPAYEIVAVKRQRPA
jgi:hypothetical protein